MKSKMKSLVMLLLLSATSLFADPVPTPVLPTPPAAPAPTLESVTKERDALKQQVAELQRAVQVMNARIQELVAQRNEANDKLAIARADAAVQQQAAQAEKK